MDRTHIQAIRYFAVIFAVTCAAACGPMPSGNDASASSDAASDGAVALSDSNSPAMNTGASVVEFTPGAGAGFGQSRMPDIVLGPPQGTGDMIGSTHVVSLGRGGKICLRMTAPIEDRPGPDFIVFENPFFVAGVERTFVELGEVSVSEDGQRFATFECQRTAPYRGCAGVTPVYSSPSNAIEATDPRYSGGDAFDLSALSMTRATVVCVRDLETEGLMPPATGFDLDAIVAVRAAP